MMIKKVTLDPETIAMILAVLIPLIQDCLAKRESKNYIVDVLRWPNAIARRRLLRQLPKRERNELRGYWRSVKNRTITKRFATRLVAMAAKKAA